MSLSRTNAHEGRDPTVIGESCPSVFAAGYLGLSIDDLTSLLLELERRELIKPYSGGVRLGHWRTGEACQSDCRGCSQRPS